MHPHFFFFYSLLIHFLVSWPFLQIDAELISIYHPMSEEAPVATDIPMEGFLDSVDAVARAMVFATAAIAKEVFAEAQFFHLSLF